MWYHRGVSQDAVVCLPDQLLCRQIRVFERRHIGGERTQVASARSLPRSGGSRRPSG